MQIIISLSGNVVTKANYSITAILLVEIYVKYTYTDTDIHIETKVCNTYIHTYIGD